MIRTARIKDRKSLLKRLGSSVAAKPHRIGRGFTARHFSEDMFGRQIGPLLMVDHFVMTEPTSPTSKSSCSSCEPSHVVIMAAKPIREPFVRHGALVMSKAADVQRTLADYAAGRFGRLPT
jgi:hypothetical protein